MRLLVFDTHRYDRASFERANPAFGHVLTFLEARLTAQTASLARGYPAVCSFVSDRVDAPCLEALREGGTRLIALRSAGFNHVDLAAAERLGLAVVRVPEYSPEAVAEHAVALALALTRKLHRAYVRVRELNFSLDGLVGFNLHGKTVGLVGLGQIGVAAALIFRGFGCRVLAADPVRQPALAEQLGLRYVEREELYREADLVSLHLPLTEGTHHLIDRRALAQMKRGVTLINTSRGGLVDGPALIDALKSGQVGAAGLDVYEEEAGIFFSDLSSEGLADDVLARLLSFPNVLVTSHQGFLTEEALENIATTTLANVRAFEEGRPLVNAVRAAAPRPPRP